jgi:hypothetical protein
LQPITGLVECEIAEFEFLGRKSPAEPLICVAEIMTHARLTSNCRSDLGIQQIFTSPS